jgi:hypothetical protein
MDSNIDDMLQFRDLHPEGTAVHRDLEGLSLLKLTDLRPFDQDNTVNLCRTK